MHFLLVLDESLKMLVLISTGIVKNGKKIRIMMLTIQSEKKVLGSVSRSIAFVVMKNIAIIIALHLNKDLFNFFPFLFNQKESKICFFLLFAAAF